MTVFANSVMVRLTLSYTTPNAGFLLASVEGTTVCLEIPLNPPPPRGETVTWRLSPQWGRALRATGGDFKGGGICVLQHSVTLALWGACPSCYICT